ncbi:hypothetical protein Tco_1136265 [Tanacetum coccineum]
MMTAFELVNRDHLPGRCLHRDEFQSFAHEFTCPEGSYAVRCGGGMRREKGLADEPRGSADDLAVQHIMRTQALEAGARIDALEDTADPKIAPRGIGPQEPRGYGSPRDSPTVYTTPPRSQTLHTTSVTNAQLQAMIDEGVTAVLAARATTRNGDDSHTSGTGARRNERTVRECTYQDFMKCQPVFFRGTEEVVNLTQWFERIEPYSA